MSEEGLEIKLNNITGSAALSWAMSFVLTKSNVSFQFSIVINRNILHLYRVCNVVVCDVTRELAPTTPQLYVTGMQIWTLNYHTPLACTEKFASCTIAVTLVIVKTTIKDLFIRLFVFVSRPCSVALWTWCCWCQLIHVSHPVFILKSPWPPYWMDLSVFF